MILLTSLVAGSTSLEHTYGSQLLGTAGQIYDSKILLLKWQIIFYMDSWDNALLMAAMDLMGFGWHVGQKSKVNGT